MPDRWSGESLRRLIGENNVSVLKGEKDGREFILSCVRFALNNLFIVSHLFTSECG